ncbi:hypothetical protein [Sphingopyxis flava]|uniref:Lipoprotein n=1 Tax=Sphingopyxis flava TaxID=1507287 RepID=A0A1T5ADP7_9SPHN|nr:hypothetical protein [Sphingopyxis flava]SKB33094.1 hypothetical protein SAMN06295937_1003136 [Sphingopyxis flava]
MRKLSWLFALGVLFLTGCTRPQSEQQDRSVDEANPLEIAARERGVVRLGAAEPTGVFERTHELGRDALCVVPVGTGSWRFAVSAAFGPGLSCHAAGSVAREGEGWRFTFASAEDCSIVLHEEEDELQLPGKLPLQCEGLCPGRTSLAGLRLPRASWSAADAKRLQMRNREGNMSRPCSD